MITTSVSGVIMIIIISMTITMSSESGVTCDRMFTTTKVNKQN